MNLRAFQRAAYARAASQDKQTVPGKHQIGGGAIEIILVVTLFIFIVLPLYVLKKPVKRNNNNEIETHTRPVTVRCVEKKRVF